MSRTNVTQLMYNVFTDYSDAVSQKVIETLYKVGKDAAEEFKSIGDFKNRTGKYRRSWTVTQEERRTYTETVVHAKAPHYRLTHLLEYGHKPNSKAFPHIRTVNDKAVKEAEQEIIKAIERIK